MASTSITIDPAEHERLDKYALRHRRVEMELRDLGDDAPQELRDAKDTLYWEYTAEEVNLRRALEARTGRSVCLRLDVTDDEAREVSLGECLRSARYWTRRRPLERRARVAEWAAQAEDTVRLYRNAGAPTGTPVGAPYKHALNELRSHRDALHRLDASLEAGRRCSAVVGGGGVERRPRSRGAGRPPARRASHRSSAKSSDSGDDSGSSEPPGEPERRCIICSDLIPERHPDTGRKVRDDRKYCFGDACKQNAYDAKQVLLKPLVERVYGNDSLFRVGDKSKQQQADEADSRKAGCQCGRALLDDQTLRCLKCGLRYRATPYYHHLWTLLEKRWRVPDPVQAPIFLGKHGESRPVARRLDAAFGMFAFSDDRCRGAAPRVIDEGYDESVIQMAETLFAAAQRRDRLAVAA